MKQTFDIELSKSLLSRLLGPLGSSLQRPIFKGAVQELGAVEKYLKQRHSETRAQVPEVGAGILFL